jgi:dUTP pyrophosphatase
MGDLQLKIKRLTATARLPTRATEGSAGLDLYADLGSEGAPHFIDSYGDYRPISTGIALEIPPGHVGLVRGRSGLAKQGIVCFHGTIDADFRGELIVLLCSPDCFRVVHGDRIAQLVIAAVPRVEIVEAWELGETGRGSSGFGSSGT